MFGSDKRVLLRHYLEQGMSKAAIARQLGVSRRTVYYWIQKGQLHRGGQEEPVQYGRVSPHSSQSRSSEKRILFPVLTLCLQHSHRRSRRVACRSIAV